MWRCEGEESKGEGKGKRIGKKRARERMDKWCGDQAYKDVSRSLRIGVKKHGDETLLWQGIYMPG